MFEEIEYVTKGTDHQNPDLTIFTYKSWDNHELSTLWGVQYDFREMDGELNYVRMVRVF